MYMYHSHIPLEGRRSTSTPAAWSIPREARGGRTPSSSVTIEPGRLPAPSPASRQPPASARCSPGPGPLPAAWKGPPPPAPAAPPLPLPAPRPTPSAPAPSQRCWRAGRPPSPPRWAALQRAAAAAEACRQVQLQVLVALGAACPPSSPLWRPAGRGQGPPAPGCCRVERPAGQRGNVDGRIFMSGEAGI